MIFEQNLFEIMPMDVVEMEEGMKIQRHDFRRMFVEQSVDRGLHLRVLDLLRQIFDDAFLVLEPKRIEKIHQQLVLLLQKPGA